MPGQYARSDTLATAATSYFPANTYRAELLPLAHTIAAFGNTGYDTPPLPADDFYSPRHARQFRIFLSMMKRRTRRAFQPLKVF